jgi:molybdate-binding protein
MEAAARSFGLGFRPLEDHAVELWLDARWVALPAAAALVEVLASAAFRSRIELIGGYDLAGCGSERRAS